jgi:hypothetical protein
MKFSMGMAFDRTACRHKNTIWCCCRGRNYSNSIADMLRILGQWGHSAAGRPLARSGPAPAPPLPDDAHSRWTCTAVGRRGHVSDQPRARRDRAPGWMHFAHHKLAGTSWDGVWFTSCPQPWRPQWACGAPGRSSVYVGQWPDRLGDTCCLLLCSFASAAATSSLPLTEARERRCHHHLPKPKGRSGMSSSPGGRSSRRGQMRSQRARKGLVEGGAGAAAGGERHTRQGRRRCEGAGGGTTAGRGMAAGRREESGIA